MATEQAEANPEPTSQPASSQAAIAVVLIGGDLAADPGGQAGCEVRVRNTGSIVDKITVEVLGVPAGWATVNPHSVNVYPQNEAVVAISFAPPRAPDTPAGRSVFDIRARSSENPAVVAQGQGSIEVGAYHELTVDVVPHTSTGRFVAHHSLTLHNRGNTRVEISLEAEDSDRLARFDLRPQRMTVEAGGQAATELRVRPRRWLWLGAPRLLPFQVTGTPDQGEPASAGAHMQQRALLPRWVPRVALFLMAAFGILLAYLLMWGTVPAVVQLPPVAAVAKLKVAGFSAAQIPQASDSVDAGKVIRTDPDANARRRKGTSVKVFYSVGPNPVQVPNLMGLPGPEAVRQVLAAQLVAQEVLRSDPTIATGTVLSTDPLANTLVARNSTVTVAVSSGPAPVPVPSAPASPSPGSGTSPGVAPQPTQVPAVGLQPTAGTQPTAPAMRPPVVVPVVPSANPSGTVPPGSPVPPPPPGPAKFAATWTNADPATLDITKAAIRFDTSRIYVHLWGKCSPTDCDWGEASVPVASASSGTLPVKFVFSFAEETQQVTLVGDQLKITGTTHYTDSSGRTDRSYVDLFNKTGPAPIRTGADPFLGSWTNSNPKTNDITRAALRSDPATLYVHMWGKCSPTDCDWGETSTPLSSANGGTVSLRWVFSFKVETQTLTLLPDGRLHVQGLAHYTDNSGRVDRSYTDDFSRA